MADEKTLSATPYAVHIPDEYTAQEKADGASWELGAGHYEFGFVIDGARFPLARLKGGGVQKKLAAARKDGYTPPEPTKAPPASDTSSLEARLAALEAAQQAPPADTATPGGEQGGLSEDEQGGSSTSTSTGSQAQQ